MNIDGTNKFNTSSDEEKVLFEDIKNFVNSKGLPYLATALANKYHVNADGLVYALSKVSEDSILVQTDILDIPELAKYVEDYGIDLDGLETLYTEFMHNLMQYLFVDATLLSREFLDLYMYINKNRGNLFGSQV